MRRLVVLGIISMLVLSSGAAALAWEFKMTGETIWRYRYVTQTGDNDIFGRLDENIRLGINHLRDYPTPGTTNRFGANGIGIIAGEHNFGPDMSLTDYRATIYPTIKVNKAIKLTGSVNLTSLGIHSNGRPYYNMEMFNSPTQEGGGYANSLWVPISDRMAGSNVPNMYLTLQWWKASIKTPMLNFSIGTKTSGAGVGYWKNKLDRSSTSFAISARYGPFKFGTSPYFGRANTGWNRWPRNDRHDNNPWRNEGARNYFGGLTLFIHYASGPLEFTFAQDGWHTPNWPDAAYEFRAADGVPQAIGPYNAGSRPGEDTWVYDSVVGLKYFNGRFFANAEVAHFWEYNSGRGTTENNGTRTRVGRNQDAWMYALEGGIVAGPSKLTLSYVRATGDDPGTRITNEDAANGDAGVSPYAMLPWGYLMYYVYGTGTSWNQAGEGQPSNFHHAGIRLDHAVASNLNVFGVFSYSWRDQTNAFWLGGNGQYAALRLTNEDLRTNAANVAAVPDSAKDIGWEVDSGFTWRLLENLDWNFTFAYWQPGSFWGYAYPNTAEIYRGNWPNAPQDYARARVDPTRTIDPLCAFWTSLDIDF